MLDFPDSPTTGQVFQTPAGLFKWDGTKWVPTSGGGGFSTGDVKLTFKLVADPNWVMMNDLSIGDALSGATNRANADTVNLFTLFYNNCADADVPIQTSTGAATTRAAQGTAATAYANHCRLVLPKALGRDLAVAGSGAGLTSRALGSAAGAETHTQTQGELVAHTHVSDFDSNPGFAYATGGNGSTPVCGGASATNWPGIQAVYNTGGGAAMSIINPRVHLNVMVCL